METLHEEFVQCNSDLLTQNIVFWSLHTLKLVHYVTECIVYTGSYMAAFEVQQSGTLVLDTFYLNGDRQQIHHDVHEASAALMKTSDQCGAMRRL